MSFHDLGIRELGEARHNRRLERRRVCDESRPCSLPRRASPTATRVDRLAGVMGRQIVSRSGDGDVHRPHDFSCGDFQLCGDRDFLGSLYTRHTPSGELTGTEAGQNGELERVEIRGTLHHLRLPFLRTARRG